MATTKTAKGSATSATKTTTRKTTAKPAAKPVNKVEEPVEKEIEVVKKKPEKVEHDLSELIPVLNGFHGTMVYKSTRTNETFVWDDFGDYQDIELRELRSAKTTSKKFFTNNWFMFSEEYDWVIDYLGVRQFYKNAVDIDTFGEILDRSPEGIKKLVKEMSPGQKKSLLYLVKQKVADNEIDSIKIIRALEDSLGVFLLEKE